MKIKNTLLLLLVLLALSTKVALSQSTDFAGAQPTLTHYKALYYLNESDPKKIKMTLRNIDNAFEDPRLKGKLEVELVAYSDGYIVYDKNGPYEEMLKK